jgi:hypothetical protein
VLAPLTALHPFWPHCSASEVTVSLAQRPRSTEPKLSLKSTVVAVVCGFSSRSAGTPMTLTVRHCA